MMPNRLATSRRHIGAAIAFAEASSPEVHKHANRTERAPP